MSNRMTGVRYIPMNAVNQYSGACKAKTCVQYLHRTAYEKCDCAQRCASQDSSAGRRLPRHEMVSKGYSLDRAGQCKESLLQRRLPVVSQRSTTS